MTEHYHPSLNNPDAWVPYRYEPFNLGAIIFVVLFSGSTGYHSFQLIRQRTWYFIPLVIGGIFEIVGYIGRLLSATGDLWALGPYTMQSLLLLVAPAFFAASIYIILGRIILLVDGEPFSLIRQRWLTKFFVCGDILSFTVQIAGGGIQAIGTLSALHLGERLIIIRLFIQLAFFNFFITVAGVFHFRLLQAHPIRPHAVSPFSHDLPWKKHMKLLYSTFGLIMIRSIVRVVEYHMRNNGFLFRHVYFLYIFDAVLMFLVMVLFNWGHPSDITDFMQARKRNSDNFMMIGPTSPNV